MQIGEVTASGALHHVHLQPRRIVAHQHNRGGQPNVFPLQWLHNSAPYFLISLFLAQQFPQPVIDSRGHPLLHRRKKELR